MKTPMILLRFRKALLLAVCTFMSVNVFAQPEKKLLSDKNLMQQCLTQTRFEIDSAAQAIILYEKGYAVMDNGDISFKIERVVKLLGTEAVKAFGTIDLARGKDVQITDIDATTYNLEGTQIVEQSINRSDIFKDKLTKGVIISKFNLPSLKAGSVIHYNYTIRRPGYSLPDWTFQNNYPTLYSAYEINVPDYIVFSAMLRVNEPSVEVKKRKELETCVSCNFLEGYGKDQPVYHTWVRRNVPAFKEEPFMSSNDNFVEQVKIRITAVMDNGVVRNVSKSWDDYSKKNFYKDNKLCGQAYDNNNFLNEKVEELIRDKTTDLDKAKAIFTYVRGNSSLRESGPGATADIKDVFTKHEGSFFGINLLLTAMLRKAGLNSAPVLLATKSEERLTPYYPTPQNINYLVSKVEAGQRDYFLDASGRYMPFGTLKSSCYNGYCRVITEHGGFAELYPDSVKNKTVVIATLEPAAEKNKLSLKIDYQFGVISSMRYRRGWQEDSSHVKTELVKQLKSANPAATMSGYRFINTDQPDELLKLHYEASMDLGDNQEMIYFNPYFDKFFDQNPFTATTRTYPVEMDYISDMSYIFNFRLPENYIIDDYPKSALVQLGDSKVLVMKNIMNYDEAEKHFSINSRFTSQASYFNADGYKDLRNFFDHIIEEQNKKIVLKKLP